MHREAYTIGVSGFTLAKSDAYLELPHYREVHVDLHPDFEVMEIHNRYHHRVRHYRLSSMAQRVPLVMKRRITEAHVRMVVKKTWLLFCQWEKSHSDVDYGIYRVQRRFAEIALSSGSTPKKRLQWIKDFPLP